MRKEMFAAVFAMSCCMFARADAPTLRIMPMGDSITYGSGSSGGYRVHLYTNMVARGWNVDFVGSQNGNTHTLLGDSDHEGRSGWKIANDVDGYLEDIDNFMDKDDVPDVILLHLGTNDSGLGDWQRRDRVLLYSNLIERLYFHFPQVHIIASTLLGRPTNNAEGDRRVREDFNPRIADLVVSFQAMGRNCHFVDMYSALDYTVPDGASHPADMPSDGLHPGEQGYQKMANAWLPAIEGIFTQGYGDENAPQIARCRSLDAPRRIVVDFSKAVDDATLADPARWTVSGGLNVTAVRVTAAGRSVALSLDGDLQANTAYTVTVTNLSDLKPTPNTTPSSSRAFYAIRTGWANNVLSADLDGYSLAYSLSIGETVNYGGGNVPYAVNNAADLPSSIDRVAYYLELYAPGEPLKYVWVSMDAFTHDLTKIGVPTAASGAVWQQKVSRLTVRSNVDGVVNVTDSDSGNIEFWPYNYTGNNKAGISGADGGKYDFGDECSYNNNYGCMQVHNWGERQTVFAFNNFNGGFGYSQPCLTIGNNVAYYGDPDGTNGYNARNYTVRNLAVFVHYGEDSVPPAVLSAFAYAAGTVVELTFSEEISPSSIASATFASDAFEVLDARLSDDKRSLTLATTPFDPSSRSTLTLGGVTDLFGNALANPETIVREYSLPPSMAAGAKTEAAGYKLLYFADIPERGAFNAPGAYLLDQGGYTNSFDRVGYYMELVKGNATNWVWTSFDAFTDIPAHLAVPVVANGAWYQRTVSNLTVRSNVAGVPSRDNAQTGCMEFWPCNYNFPVVLDGIGGSGDAFDWNDRPDTPTAVVGYGSMQVHDWEAGVTLWALNHFGTDGEKLDIGIGNCSDASRTDWTQKETAGNWDARRLYVFVRPGPTPDGVSEKKPASPELVSEVLTDAASLVGAETLDGWDLLFASTAIPVQCRFQDAAWRADSANFYQVDNRSTAFGVTRVAYLMQLEVGGSLEYVWTAFDAPSAIGRQLGVPEGGYYFKQWISNLEVKSNSARVTQGSFPAGGIVEFWASNYGTGNTLADSGASTSLHDWDDNDFGTGTGGYGSMQVHNAGRGEVLFAFNNFNNGNVPCLGIGNRTESHPDWTFANNAGGYTVRKLYAFVKYAAIPPHLGSVTASADGSRLLAEFDADLASRAQSTMSFTLSDGGTVASFTQLDERRVLVDVSGLVRGTTYTLTVHDAPGTGGVSSDSSATFGIPASSDGFMPEFLTSSDVPEMAGYSLVQYIDLPLTAQTIHDNTAYAFDEGDFHNGDFDRIAYCFALVPASDVSVTNWVWVSMDAFASDGSKIGIPAVDRGAWYQCKVTGMNIFSNVAGVETGTGIDTGNIEFWPQNYGSGVSSLGLGGDSGKYDFDDVINMDFGHGHGTMQVHNWGAKQTVFALNHFGNGNNTLEMGIGNNASGHPDWTSTNNAGNYNSRRLWVFVRRKSAAASGPEIKSQPASATVEADGSAVFRVAAFDVSYFQWFKDGVAIDGANGPSLTIAPVTQADAGTYTVVAYSAAGYTQSEPATLSVMRIKPKIRIMPVGDSITEGIGNGTFGGYRLPLWQYLQADGYNVDFIGTSTANGANGLGDSDHEGHSGWRITDGNGGIYEHIRGWMEGLDLPDVVLLHLGTNDTGAGEDAFRTRIVAYSNLCERIWSVSPHTHIVATTLLDRRTNYATANGWILTYFNPYVEGLVNGFKAMGRNCYFLDMYSALDYTVPDGATHPDDLGDGLHPSIQGYQKMARAWESVVTNVFSVYGDANAPKIGRVTCADDLQRVLVEFSKPVANASIYDVASYTVDAGAEITDLEIVDANRAVALTLAEPLAVSGSHTLTVTGLVDLNEPALTTASDSRVFAVSCRGYEKTVPKSEWGDMCLVYDFDWPTGWLLNMLPSQLYAVDNSSALPRAFDRVAYYVELVDNDGAMQYLWVSMDAFTNDYSAIGVPLFNAGAPVVQTRVTGMNVFCNVDGVVNTTGCDTGNIEFWPYNYGEQTALGLEGANGSQFDFDDTCTYGGRYGSMQIHNWGARQTLFAANRWNEGATILGIGPNNTGVGQPDWTHADANLSTFTSRRMQVFVRPCAEREPPKVVKAEASFDGKLVTLVFDEPISSLSLDGASFTSDAFTVGAVRILDDGRTVELTTSGFTPDGTVAVSVSGVTDLYNNPVSPNTTVPVEAISLSPAQRAQIGEAADGYDLVLRADMGVTGAFNSDAAYTLDQTSWNGTFDRVAYYLELEKNGVTNWVWTSFDAFTANLRHVGVPVSANGAWFQRKVSNLVVRSNVAGVTQVDDCDTGNIEFWSNNYSEPTAIGDIGGSGSNFDWNDTPSGQPTSAGHGSMQVHNWGEGQTLWAINHFGNDGNTLDIGIGNNSNAAHQDWTLENNAGNWDARRLYVLIRRGPTPYELRDPNSDPELLTARVRETLGADADVMDGFTLVSAAPAIPVQCRFNEANWRKSSLYTYDVRGDIGEVSEVGYFYELQTTSGDTVSTNYVWVSFDSLTDDPAKIGVPEGGYTLQGRVSNMKIRTNSDTLIAAEAVGDFATGGNIEFWSGDYGTNGGVGNLGGNNSMYDFDDSVNGNNYAATSGYGSMQVCCWEKQQVVFALNHFNGGSTAQLGIGNDPSPANASASDWTFHDNAGTYSSRVLMVFAKYAQRVPAVTSVVVSSDRTRALVRFDRPLGNASVRTAELTLSDGAQVVARSLDDDSTLLLEMYGAAANFEYTLSYQNLADASGVAFSGTAVFRVPAQTAAETVPAFLDDVAEAEEYTLIQYYDLPENSNAIYNGPAYNLDDGWFHRNDFDRVAYCLYLVPKSGEPRWVWVSMDAFATDGSKLGLPVVPRGVSYRQKVSSMNVQSSANLLGNVVWGSNLSTGNIEFWPQNYGTNVGDLGLGGSSSDFDFDDNINASFGYGYGSMQVHNWGAQQTIFAINHFGNGNQTLQLGIGNNPDAVPGGTPGLDWTHNDNAGTFSARRLYVFVRETAAATEDGPRILVQPVSCTAHDGKSAVFSVASLDATSAQWYKDGVPISGATGMTLVIEHVGFGDAGAYTVRLENASGVTVSESAELTVEPLPPGCYIIVR